MKASKTFFSVVFASVLVFSLAGCGDKEESKTFKADVKGTEIVMTYTYKGDKVIKQTSQNKINFASLGVKTKEDAAKILDPISAKYQNIPGVEEKCSRHILWSAVAYERVKWDSQGSLELLECYVRGQRK